MSGRSLNTRRGTVRFPAFFPVTTFGKAFALDEIARPYVARLAGCLMVSFHYAQKMRQPPQVPLFVDSGGFAGLFAGSSIVEQGQTAAVCTKDGQELTSDRVLAFQKKRADIGATLDFIVTPHMDLVEAKWRQELTIRNAKWAARQDRGEMRLYASLQAWDADSAARMVEQLATHRFDGYALGGMVPRLAQRELIHEIVGAVRRTDPSKPLHVFGMGQPRVVRELLDRGVDSVDSSSFLQHAAKKRYLHPQTLEYATLSEIVRPRDICGCPMCQRFDVEYLRLEGELNTMALALHNLAALTTYCL